VPTPKIKTKKKPRKGLDYFGEYHQVGIAYYNLIFHFFIGIAH